MRLGVKVAILLATCIVVSIFAGYVLFMRGFGGEEKKVFVVLSPVDKDRVSVTYTKYGGEVGVPKTWNRLSEIYLFRSSGELKKSVRIVFKINSSMLKDVDVVKVCRWVEFKCGVGFWIPVETKVFRENSTVVAEVSRFSVYCVLGRVKGKSFPKILDALKSFLDKPPSKPECTVGLFICIDYVIVSKSTYPELYPEIVDILVEKASPYLKRVGFPEYWEEVVRNDRDNPYILAIGCNADIKDGWDIRSYFYDYEKEEWRTGVEKVVTGSSSEKIRYEVLVVWNFDCGEDAVLKGRVTTDEGIPVSDADIYAVSLVGHHYETETKADGRYRMKVASAYYFIRAEKKCYDGSNRCLVCAYGKVWEPRKRRETRANIIVSGNKIVVKGSVTIRAEGSRFIGKGLWKYIYSSTVFEEYMLKFSFKIVGENETLIQFAGNGTLELYTYRLDASNIYVCDKPNLYSKIEISHTGEMKDKVVQVFVYGFLDKKWFLRDICIEIAGCPECYVCQQDAGVTKFHIVVATPVITKEDRKTFNTFIYMTLKDIERTLETADPPISFAKSYQERTIHFLLNTNDFIMLTSKGIGMGMTIEGVPLPQEPSLKEGDLEFSGKLIVEACIPEE